MTCPICGHPDSKDAESCGYQYRHPKPALMPTLSEAFDLLAAENADLKARISRALALIPDIVIYDVSRESIPTYKLIESLQAARKELEGRA